MRNVIVLAIAAAVLATAACNTIGGVGRDAQSVGKTVTKASKK